MACHSSREVLFSGPTVLLDPLFLLPPLEQVVAEVSDPPYSQGLDLETCHFHFRLILNQVEWMRQHLMAYETKVAKQPKGPKALQRQWLKISSIQSASGKSPNTSLVQNLIFATIVHSK